MVKTIGNPLTWLLRGAGAAGVHAVHVAEDIGGVDPATPVVRRIGFGDLREALRLGLADFAACRSDVVTLCFLYPVIGLCLAYMAFHANFLPMIFPLISGFALIGPVAAVGLYEMSRRREKGMPVSWATAFGVLESPALGPIAAMALYLIAFFFVWLVVAAELYGFTLGPAAPASASSFLHEVLTTGAGWTLIVLGTAIGFVFAAVVLAVSLVSFPMMIDRHVGLPVAVSTSVRVARENPMTVATWGLIVAALLALGSIPALLGLVLVLPILGHGTWHLYRKAVGWK
jgi:uncharacterized membrane protein